MRHIIALCAALVLNACANLLMKMGMKTVHEAGGLLQNGLLSAAVTVVSSGTLITGLACFTLNALLYMYALQSPALKISIAYPLMVGGGYALIAIVARVHPRLRETLTIPQYIGVALILLGIVLVAGQTHPRIE